MNIAQLHPTEMTKLHLTVSFQGLGIADNNLGIVPMVSSGNVLVK